MPQATKAEHIICFALPAWEADYLRSTVELMKCLAKNNLVLYVDYAYTLSDCIKAIRGKKKMEWKRVIGVQKRLRKIEGNDGAGLYLLSLPPVFPAFALPTIKWFEKANKINAAITGYSINKAVKQLKMKDVIGFNSFQPFLGLWWKIKEQSFSIYYCYDDYTSVPYFKGYAMKTEKEFITQTDLLIVTSDELKTRKQQKNIPVAVVHNGVHFDAFFKHAKPAGTVSAAQRVVGYTGSIDNRIDIDLLEPVVKNLPDIQFRFAGKVFDQTIYNRLSVYSHVQFLPPVNSSEVPRLMGEMQLGIIPYKINSLTAAIYPLKVNEYLAMGLPVVMTPFASIGEADEVVYRADNSNDFTAGICHAFEQNTAALQQQRIRLAQKADWAIRAQQLLTVIKHQKAKKDSVVAI